MIPFLFLMKNFLILSDIMKTYSDLKTRVYKFCSENMQRGKLYIVNHYKAECLPKSTIYRHIERKNGSGKPPFIATKKISRNLKNGSIIGVGSHLERLLEDSIAIIPPF